MNLIPRFRRWRAGCAALVCLLPLALRAELKPGDPFPALDHSQLTAGLVPATAGQVVLVDFWASWCAPCRASFPAYERLAADFGARGLVIVAVSVDDDPAAFAAFLRKFAPSFAVLRDAGHQLVAAVKVPAMPTSYLVGRDGRVRAVHVGFHTGQTEAALRTEITALLDHPT